MVWILYAVLAHVGNALVFAVDKSLLGSDGKISQPSRYAFYSGLLAGVAGLLLFVPAVYTPLTVFVVVWSSAAGVLHLVALWLFFSALKYGEPSRVVSVAGSSVPLFTLLFAVTFLGEVLVTQHLLAVLLLVAGGVLLSVRLRSIGGLSRRVLLLALASGALFAAYFSAVKYLYDNAEPFLAVFAYSRVFESVLAFFLLGPVVWFQRREVSSVRSSPGHVAWLITLVFVGNKGLAAGAFLLQSYAINLGSVTVVNALQGTQYVFLLLIAVAVSRWRPNFFREEFSLVSRWQKVVGVLLISFGVSFLACSNLFFWRGF